MNNYKGVIPFLIETAKKKGVRLEEADFDNPDIECLNEHVVIFRRGGCEIINRLFESGESGRATEKMRHGNLRLSRSPLALRLRHSHLVHRVHAALNATRKIIHRLFRAKR